MDPLTMSGGAGAYGSLLAVLILWSLVVRGRTGRTRASYWLAARVVDVNSSLT
jgi:hypothetical protein